MLRNNYIDIGCNHSIRFVEYKGDKHAAINIRHLTKDGRSCEGFVTLAGSTWAKAFEQHPSEHQTWEVHSLEPLTLSPSILCRVCGDHGYIREGKWVEA